MFYHRVADSDLANDWTISRKNFIKHLDWLSINSRIVSVADIQASQKSACRLSPEVAITFDDGYFETTQYAIPLLLDRGLNCTYFVSTHFVESGLPFPHDISRGYPHAPNTIEQIRWMASRGIEIGGHTHTHANLGIGLSSTTLRREIWDARKRLQDWSGQAIRYFAFPYGMPENMSHDAIDMVYDAGYTGFLSAYGDWNFIGDDSFHLRRIHGQSNLQFIANWLSLDPRKFRRRHNLVYSPRGRIAKLRASEDTVEFVNQV